MTCFYPQICICYRGQWWRGSAKEKATEGWESSCWWSGWGRSEFCSLLWTVPDAWVEPFLTPHSLHPGMCHIRHNTVRWM